MNDPGVILLDEPSAGLDLGGREQLVSALAELAAQAESPPFVLVTHHVDEIPVGTTHALLLRAGRAVAQGTLDRALTAEALSECFSMPLTLERRGDGRFSSWASSSRTRLTARPANLVVERLLEQPAGPQRPVVGEMHGEHGVVTIGLELDPQRPHRMLAPIDLGTLEGDPTAGLDLGALHAQSFRPRERPDASSQLDVPHRLRIVGDELDVVHESQPRRIGLESGDMLEHRIGWGRHHHRLGRAHPDRSQ